jgi:predicted nicotinamide N-methyase
MTAHFLQICMRVFLDEPNFPTTLFLLCIIKVWPASTFLCEYIVKNRELFRGRTVIELGAGSGICGLVAAKFASRVVITDGSEIAGELIRHNIEKNYSRVNSSEFSRDRTVVFQKLRWGQETAELLHQYDIVLASDVVYKNEFYTPLFNTAKNLLSKSPVSKFILCFAKRYPIQDVQIDAVAKEQNFLLSSSEQFDYNSLSIQSLLIRDEFERVYIKTFVPTNSK